MRAAAFHPPPLAAGLSFLVRHRAPLATALCALVFFLGTADRLFTLRLEGANVRLANFWLVTGLFAWIVTRRRRVIVDLAPLAAAWAPFVMLCAIAALRSADPLPGLLKLGWFAFGFVGAFVWCRLFDRAAIVRGFFCAFLAVSAIIVVDFTTGFVHGERYMIGFGQPNKLAAGEVLWRPQAFYYEPSYAASGLGLAWALAMTPMGRLASWLATTLIVVGAFALIVLMSRTGWIYALLVLLVFAGVRLRDGWREMRVRWVAVLAGFVGSALVVSAVLLPERNLTRFALLVDALGLSRTFDRVCPLLRDGVEWIELRCTDSEAALRSIGVEDAEESSEGQRIVSAQETLAQIGERPWLGHGVTRGQARLIEPVASNAWLEIAFESGLAAAAAFAWGLAWTMKRYRAFAAGNGAIGLVLVLYFVVAWQFIQTYPRLDQWLAFWAALVFAAGRGATPQAAAAPSTVRGEPRRQPIDR